MKIPRWYIFESVAWAFTGLPFFVLLALYTNRLWPLPDPPSQDLPAWHWLLAVAFLYHPILFLPVALINGRAKALNAQDR